MLTKADQIIVTERAADFVFAHADKVTFGDLNAVRRLFVSGATGEPYRFMTATPLTIAQLDIRRLAYVSGAIASEADHRHTLKAVTADGIKMQPALPSDTKFAYGDWHIQLASAIRPSAAVDWDFWHDDYDGPEDGRCGAGFSPNDCIQQINDMEDDA